MNPLLFLGSDFLQRMTAPDASADERESRSYGLAAYLDREGGLSAASAIVKAFNELNVDDALTLDRNVVLWYLDWLTLERPDLQSDVDAAALVTLWSAFNEPVVRTRVLESLIDLESTRDVRPEHSSVLRIVALARGGGERPMSLSDDFVEPRDVSTDLLSQIVVTLLTDQRPFSLRVLGTALAELPQHEREIADESINELLPTLGVERAAFIRSTIDSQRRE
jgi:hypothetical protein